MRQIEQQKQEALNISIARELLTAITLIVSLLVTYNLWETAMHNTERALETTFEFRVRQANDSIQQRLSVYEQVLRAGVGLFSASDTVTRTGFHRFVNALDLAKSYPGIQGIGYAEVVPPAEKDRHIAAIRHEGFPEYSISPAGQRDIYTSIIYLEPFSGRNLRAFGYDMYSDPVRQAAMAHARDTGNVAVSRKVILVQEAGTDVQAGFLMYLPVYRNGSSHDTVAERRMNLIGWVYAPFRMNDFMRGVEGVRGNDLDIEIYDDHMISDATRMFDSDHTLRAIDPHTELKRIDDIQAGDRTWTIAMAALPAFEQQMRSDRPQLVLRTGISISLMVSLLMWIFLDDRARAIRAAHQAMQLALYDALTGLPNRKLLEERLTHALTKAKRDGHRLALLFIDLDQFKPVNDNYGHAYGDLLLKKVATRLHDCMRASDTASRLGGDEFVALISDIESKNDVMVVATKILRELSRPYEIVGEVFRISASIGAAIYPEDGTDGKSLVKSADLAMYHAKNNGRANVRFAHHEASEAPR